MKITIEVPDTTIDAALESPHSRYWASEAVWSHGPDGREGYVVERHGSFEGKPERHTLGASKLKTALAFMATHYPRQFGKLMSATWGGETGLQLMAFGEVRYG